MKYRAQFDAELRDIHTSLLDIQLGNQDCVYPLHSSNPDGKPESLLSLLRLEIDHHDEPCSSAVCLTSADRRKLRYGN